MNNNQIYLKWEREKERGKRKKKKERKRGEREGRDRKKGKREKDGFTRVFCCSSAQKLGENPYVLD